MAPRLEQKAQAKIVDSGVVWHCLGHQKWHDGWGLDGSGHPDRNPYIMGFFGIPIAINGRFSWIDNQPPGVWSNFPLHSWSKQWTVRSFVPCRSQYRMKSAGIQKKSGDISLSFWPLKTWSVFIHVLLFYHIYPLSWFSNLWEQHSVLQAPSVAALQSNSQGCHKDRSHLIVGCMLDVDLNRTENRGNPAGKTPQNGPKMAKQL